MDLGTLQSLRIEDLPIPDDAVVTAAWQPQMTELAYWIGPQGALLLAEAHGGRELYVPVTIPDDHELVRLLGPGRAGKLSEIYARERLLLPVARQLINEAKRRPVMDAVRDGRLNKKQAAKILRTARTWVIELAKQEAAAVTPGLPVPRPRQTELF